MSKMHFTMIIEGSDSMQTKFDKTLEDNPKIGNSLLNAIACAIICTFKFSDEDQVKVTSFSGGAFIDPQQAENQERKPVENTDTPLLEQTS